MRPTLPSGAPFTPSQEVKSVIGFSLILSGSWAVSTRRRQQHGGFRRPHQGANMPLPESLLFPYLRKALCRIYTKFPLCSCF